MKKTVNWVITSLISFWLSKGFVFFPSLDLRKGAGTLNLNLLLEIIKSEDKKIFSIERCSRPNDGFGLLKGCRLFNHLQFEVFHTGENINLDLFEESLEFIGLKNYKLFPDNWEHFVLGAKGNGWEAHYSGFEFAQITYFNQIGGVNLKKEVLELAYGIERISMILQDVTDIENLLYSDDVYYKDIFQMPETQYSEKNLIILADNKKLLDLHFKMLQKFMSKKKYYLALEEILYCSQVLNEQSEFLEQEFSTVKMIELSNFSKIIFKHFMG